MSAHKTTTRDFDHGAIDTFETMCECAARTRGDEDKTLFDT